MALKTKFGGFGMIYYLMDFLKNITLENDTNTITNDLVTLLTPGKFH